MIFMKLMWIASFKLESYMHYFQTCKMTLFQLFCYISSLKILGITLKQQ